MATAPTFYHFGFVVDDLDQAMADFSTALGLKWRDVSEISMSMLVGGEAVEYDIKAVYSTDSPVAIELIQTIPGSYLEPNNGGSFHHIGRWSPDLPADARHLEAVGCPLIATASDERGDHPSLFSMHTSPLGFHLELCDPSFVRGFPPMHDLVPDVD